MYTNDQSISNPGRQDVSILRTSIVKRAHLFALSLGQETVLLGLFVLTFITHQTFEEFLVRLVNIHRLTLVAFGIETGVKEHGFNAVRG